MCIAKSNVCFFHKKVKVELKSVRHNIMNFKNLDWIISYYYNNYLPHFGFSA